MMVFNLNMLTSILENSKEMFRLFKKHWKRRKRIRRLKEQGASDSLHKENCKMQLHLMKWKEKDELVPFAGKQREVQYFDI